MAVKLLIFDLDGTLVDSAEDIARSINELRARLDHSRLRLEDVYAYIGDGVGKLLERSFPNASKEILDRAKEMYLPIYRRRLLDNTRPYPGVTQALDALRECGCTLTVLTNKPLRESLMILEGLGLRHYFRAVHGGDSFERRKPDPMGVRRLLDDSRLSPAEALFVGDSHVDLETARNAAVRCCLVSYGIRAFEAAALDPDFRVDDLRELRRLVEVGT